MTFLREKRSRYGPTNSGSRMRGRLYSTMNAANATEFSVSAYTSSPIAQPATAEPSMEISEPTVMIVKFLLQSDTGFSSMA